MKNVLVIGSGIAGLSSAYHLSKAGFQVKIIESTNHHGGRLTALFDSKTGETIDNGQHVLMSAYTSFLELLPKEIVDNLLKIQKSLFIKYIDNLQRISTLNCGILPDKAGIALGFLSLKHISFSSKIEIIKLLNKISKGLYPSKTDNCYDFLIRNNQRYDSIERFWEPIIIGTMNTPAKEASAEILVNIIKKIFIEDLKNSKLIFPITDLPTLLDPIKSAIIENGGCFEFNTKIKKILFIKDKVLGAQNHFGKMFVSDFIVSSIPPFLLYKIIPDDKKGSFEYLTKFNYSPIISIYLWMYKPLFDDDFIACTGTNIQWIFNRRKLLKNDTSYKFPYSYSITLSAADSFIGFTAKETLAMIIIDLKALFKNFCDDDIAYYRIIIEKFATIKQTPEIEFLRPQQQTIYDNLFLSGDWTKTGLPATIESGALSGKIVSELICNKFK